MAYKTLEFTQNEIVNVLSLLRKDKMKNVELNSLELRSTGIKYQTPSYLWFKNFHGFSLEYIMNWCHQRSSFFGYELNYSLKLTNKEDFSFEHSLSLSLNGVELFSTHNTEKINIYIQLMNNAIFQNIPLENNQAA